jgi:heat shock protein HtpX
MYGNTNITYFVIAVVAIYALIQYFIADKLSVAMTGARRIEKSDNPRFYRIVENLAITIGIPTPQVYIIDDPAPNAFATGRDPKHAIVAATSGLIDIMNDSELEAVMAHEMGHVQNYDIRVSMITFGLVSAIGLLTNLILRMFIFGDRDNNNSNPIGMIAGIIVIILAPIIAAVIQLAVSRQLEYLADATSAMTTRNPDAMISALQKLQKQGKPMMRQSSSSAHLFFINPLKPGFMNKLFSTHPPIEDRIARLQNNEGKF